MAISNGYATLAELKTNLGISDSTDDTILEDKIEAASRAIDKDTGRTFFVTSAEARYFTAEEDAACCFTDDIVTVTSIKTDDDGDRTYETTWATTDYDLIPFNRTPKTRIRLAPNGRYGFPTHAKGVEVTATFGYAAAVPDDIKEACLLFAARLYKRKDAPFGAVGGVELGFARIPRLDPDVSHMLESYRRIEAVAVG